MPLIAERELDAIGGRRSYHVKSGALTIGRIYAAELSGGIVQWQWSIQNVPTLGVQSYGSAKDFEGALAGLRTAWKAWLSAVGLQETDQ